MVLKKKKWSEEMTTSERVEAVRDNGTIVLDTNEMTCYIYNNGWIRQGKYIKL